MDQEATFELGNPNRSEPEKYTSHQHASDSGNRVFRDRDGDLLLLVDEGFVVRGFTVMSVNYPSYPIVAVEEPLVIRNP
jgi:hypothetical protein